MYVGSFLFILLEKDFSGIRITIEGTLRDIHEVESTFF